MKLNLQSRLAKDIRELIRYKNSQGFSYKTQAYFLMRFDKMCASDFPDEDTVTKNMAMSWATLKDSEHPNYFVGRLGPVRELAKFIVLQGRKAFVIPKGLPAHTIPYIPYIYTKQEIAALIRAADEMARSCSTNHWTVKRMLPVILRLLYATGMRQGEARLLRAANVDLGQGRLLISESKNESGRFVYISDELSEILKKYDLARGPRIWFFGREDDKPHSEHWLDAYFPKLKIMAGIEEEGIRKRIHDLRHTFCVHRLNEWVEQGRDLNGCLPYLSEYIGHKSIEATDYYLHLIPEFYGNYSELTRRQERLIPQIGVEP